MSAHSNLVDYELGRRIPPPDIVAACEALFELPRGYLARLRGARLRLPADPPGGPATPSGHVTSSAPNAPSQPMQLPAEVVGFTGRTRYLAQLDTLLRTGAATGALPIGAIVGTAGVGKTALAVHWAHRVRDRFPDGQLYVDLQAYSLGPPLQPIDALARFLRAVDVPTERIPSTVEEAAAMYRSVLATRRMLVVLDNAGRPDQVRPLLPGAAGCLVLVTCRNRLDGLVARDGARQILLDLLTEEEAVALLARLVGAERMAAEPRAASALVNACARLPLALRIAAARLTGQPGLGIADFMSGLANGNRIAALHVEDDDDTAIRTAFDLSYATLPSAAQRLFRAVGSAPDPVVTPEAAAALAGTTAERAGRMLDQMARAHLLAQPGPGRYVLHDLLRAYAAECRPDDEPAA